MKTEISMSRTVQIYDYEPMTYAIKVEADIPKERFDKAIDSMAKKLSNKIETFLTDKCEEVRTREGDQNDADFD